MSNSKTYLLQQKYQNATITLKEQSQTNKNFNKIATLQPYLADIERRQKIKSKLSRNNKNKNNQSSSRSFRIKDVSTSSLHKLNFDKIDIKPPKLDKNKQTIHTTGTLANPNKIKASNEAFARQRKTKSQHNRPVQSSFSKTLIVKQVLDLPKNTALKIQSQSPEKTNVFNDYFLRMNKNKDTKPKFRKNLYEIMLPKKNSMTEDTKIQHQIKKICNSILLLAASTEFNIDRSLNKDKKEIESEFKNGKKTQVLRKNNFRRGKYELALHSSVNEKPESDHTEPLQSQRLYQLNKKQSNLSINQQMDIIAENQMQKFYRQVRTKEIQKSLEKSTEKYFGTDSYRPVKSKNQIQFYVSSIMNPSLNKISQSTYDKSNRNRSPLDLKNKTDIYAYNFDFEPQKNTIGQKISETQNPLQEQQSFSNLNDKQFQRQRKIAEIQYFHKDHPQIEWSDEDCQVDDI